MITTQNVRPTDPVTRLLTRTPVYVQPDAPLLKVAETLTEESIGVVLVYALPGSVEIVSERDLAVALAENGAAEGLEARDVMTSDVASVESTASILGAARTMLDNEVRHLTVTSGQATVGVLSIRE